jgi:hypothetical protein
MNETVPAIEGPYPPMPREFEPRTTDYQTRLGSVLCPQNPGGVASETVTDRPNYLISRPDQPIFASTTVAKAPLTA